MEEINSILADTAMKIAEKGKLISIEKDYLVIEIGDKMIDVYNGEVIIDFSIGQLKFKLKDYPSAREKLIERVKTVVKDVCIPILKF